MIACLNDADLYERDASLYDNGKWLNSPCVLFSFRFWELESADRLDQLVSYGVMLVDPSVVSYFRFQIGDEEERHDFQSGSGLMDKEWLLIPVSNATSLLDSGSHWSLLVFHKGTSTGFHLDSMGGANTSVAQHTLQRLLFCFDVSGGSEANVVQVRCPRQEEGYNCGVFAILFAICLTINLCSEEGSGLTQGSKERNVQQMASEMGRVVSDISSTQANDYRKHMRMEIEKLRG